MDKIISFVNENPMIWLYVGFMFIAVVFSIVSMRRAKAGKVDFLDNHPDAARILLNQQGYISTTIIHLYEVNDEPVQLDFKTFNKATTKESQYYSEKMKYGVLVKPGVNKLLVSYENTKPGVVHKSVTTYSDPVHVEINCAANTTYRLSYDLDTNLYSVEEVTK